MSPTLLRALLAIVEAGGVVRDVIRIDVGGQHTNLAISWPSEGTRLVRYHDDDEERLAEQLMIRLAAVSAHPTSIGKVPS